MSQIKRKKRENNFSIIPNEVVNDSSISFKAKGLLIYLLSKPDDWQTYVIQLSNVATDGKDSVRSGLAELMKAGYVTREKTRNENGKFTGYDYTVNDEPYSDKPYTENPTTAKPTTANPQLLRTDSNKELNKKRTERNTRPSFLERGKTAKAMKQSICFESKEQMKAEISKQEYSEYLIQASAKWRGMNEKGKDSFLDEFAGKNATIKEYGNLKETYQTGIKTHMMNSLKYYEPAKEQTTSTYAYYYKIGNKEKKHNDKAMWERDKRNFGNGQGYKEISILV